MKFSVQNLHVFVQNIFKMELMHVLYIVCYDIDQTKQFCWPF